MDKISFLISLQSSCFLVPAPLLCAKSPVSSEHGVTGGRIHWDSGRP